MIHTLSAFVLLLAGCAAFQVPQLPSASVQHRSGLWLPASTTPESDTSYHAGKYEDPNNSNYRRLSDALKAAEYDRKKVEEESRKIAEAWERERNARKMKVDFMKNLPDDLVAGNVEDFMYKEGVKAILEKLDYDLVGLKPVKTRVREIASLLVIDKMRQAIGLETAVPTLHMSFTGAPGTGKTTVAKRMGEILSVMGYCRRGHVVVATRDDLVGQYVGHTGPKTKEMIKKASGGVLFIDEAYYLYNAANDRDYGVESLEILLQVMETRKEDLIVMFAGYKDLIDKFFSYIPGLASRVGNHIEFPNYEVDELVEIAKVMARDLKYGLPDDSADVFRDYIRMRMSFPYFSNARTVRNAMDRARMNAALRVFEQHVEDENDSGVVEPEELSNLYPEDFRRLIKELEEASADAIIA